MAELPYHTRVATTIRQGVRVGMWLGAGAGLIAAIVASATLAPAAALLMAPMYGILGMAAGAIAGGAGGMLFGAVRHSRLFHHPMPERDRAEDLAALQRRVQDALVPEPVLLNDGPSANPMNIGFAEMVERRRASAATNQVQR